MRISFDIDNTLIPYFNEFETEKVHLMAKWLGVEAVRKNSTDLFQQLQHQGHECWIYTSSYRPISKMKRTFLYHGIRPDGYINGAISQKMLLKHHSSGSKNPKLFGIDLHIDDSLGVVQEGEQLGFQCLHLPTTLSTNEWVEVVLQRVQEINDSSYF